MIEALTSRYKRYRDIDSPRDSISYQENVMRVIFHWFVSNPDINRYRQLNRMLKKKEKFHGNMHLLAPS
jgi:hypothetical protein